MRQFYIEIDGVRTGLNKESGIFLSSPTGLGASFSATYSKISDGFYYGSDRYESQGQICGDLNFFGTAYASYLAFVNSLFSAESLVLVYKPLSVEYKCDVAVSSVTKSEAVGSFYMTVPIVFDKLGMWYTEETLTGTGSVSVTSGGQMASCVKVTSEGALTNPLLTLSASGTDFATADVTATLVSGDLFEYSNYYDDSHCFGTVSGVATDFVPLCDIDYTLYGRAKGAYTVTLTDDDEATPSITAVVRKYWRTV